MTMNLVPEIEIILDMIDNFDPNENEESDIFLLAQDFNISKREVKDNQHLLGKSIFRNVLQQRGIDEKQIKKLLR